MAKFKNSELLMKDNKKIILGNNLQSSIQNDGTNLIIDCDNTIIKGQTKLDPFRSGNLETIITNTSSQVLENKTLTTPTIANFQNATHAHSSPDQGGTLDASSIASGKLAMQRGGLGADVSNLSGLLSIDAGITTSKLVSPFGLSLIDDTSALTAQNTLGIVPGINVQNYNVNLQAY